MMKRDYVADTGPLISFERIPDGFSLLRHLTRTVIIPFQVLRELQAGRPGEQAYLQEQGIDDFIQVVPAPELLSDTAGLHEGERAAIALATARQLPILIEERQGHAAAEALGLRSIGAVGLILDGWSRGLVTGLDAAQYFRALHAGRRISINLLQGLLGQVLTH